MNRIHVVFLVCWAAAMLGLGAMSIGYVLIGKFVAYGFGIVAMILGFYSFVRLMKE